MKEVSAEIRNTVYDGTVVYTRAYITAYDKGLGRNITFLCSDSSFTLEGNSYSENGGYNFPIGNVISKSVTLSLDNSKGKYNNYDFDGAKIRLISQVLTDDGKVGLEEGIFYVLEVNTLYYKLTLTAFDIAADMGFEYAIRNVSPSGTKLYNTLWDYFVYLCDEVLSNHLGITLASGEHLYAPRLEGSRFANSTMVLAPIEYDGTRKTTFRDILGYIAQLAGGNAVIVVDSGKCYVDIREYNFLEHKIIYCGKFGDSITNVNCKTYEGGLISDPVPTNRYFVGLITDPSGYALNRFSTPPNIPSQSVEYTGVKILYPIPNNPEGGSAKYYGDSQAPEKNMLVLENPLAEDSSDNSSKVIAVAKTLVSHLCDASIYPFDGSFDSNPLLEFMDNVIVEDIDCAAYTSFVSDHTMNYLGYSEIANRTVSDKQNNRKYYR